MVDEIKTLGRNAFRPYEVPDVPSSGPHNPDKLTEIYPFVDTINDKVELLIESQDGGSVQFNTWAALAAADVTGKPTGTPGEVTGPDAGTHTDPVTAGTVANIGKYHLVSGTGWRWDSVNSVAAVTAEVVAARGTFIDLDARMDSIDIRGIHLLTANASSDGLDYTANAPAWITALQTGMVFLWDPPIDNAGTTRLNINSIGLKSVHDSNDQALMSGMIQAGSVYLLYAASSTSLILIGVIRLKSFYDVNVLHEISFGPNGTSKAKLSVSAAGELIISSSVSGVMTEVARIDSGSAKPRFLYGVLMGLTAATAVSPYSSLSPQPYEPEGRTAYDAERVFTTFPVRRKPEDVDPLVITTTVPYCVSYGDLGRTIQVNVADGYLDLQKMATGVSLDVYVGTGGSHSVHLYCGPAAAWRGQAAGDRTLTYNTLSILRIYRVDVVNYIITATVGTLSLTGASTLPAARAVTLVTAGQSLSVQFFDEAGLAGLQSGLSALSPPVSRSMWPISGGLGSSSLLRVNDASDINYWWDSSTGLPGPRATALIAAINGRPAGQRAPDILMWDQGEADYLYIAAGGSSTPAIYQTTLATLFAWIRTQLSMATLPIVICPLGAADNSQNPGGYTAIREAQLAVIAADIHCYHGHEKYDLSRKFRNPHLDFTAQLEEGRRFASVVDNILNATTHDLGPEIVAFTELTSTTFAVDISAGTLFRPGSTQNMSGPPIGFALLPSSDPLGAPYTVIKTQWSVTGGSLNRLTLTTSAAASGCRLAYPYGSMQEMRTQRIVSDYFTYLPLRTYAGA